jgi:short-subunit dehydrogenase
MDEVRHMFELNVIAPLDMTQLVVPQMRERGSGAIVNLGSIVGKITLPWLTMYSASKYAVGAITDGLRMELRADGIHAMTVCPGYVRTRFATNVLAGDSPDSVRRSRQFSITPEQCAKAIANGLERNARVIVTPSSGWALVIAERLFPTLVDRLMERLYHAQQREARRIAG